VAILAVDVTKRAHRLSAFEQRELTFYLLSFLLSLAFWGSVAIVAASRKTPSRWLARALLVFGAVFAFGAQVYTYDRYQAYLDHRAVLVGTQMMPSVGQQLWFDRVTLAKALLPPMALALLLPLFMRRLAPARTMVVGAAWDTAVTALLFSMFLSPERGADQGTLPDVMYFSSMGQLARARWDHNETVERVHPGPRTPIPVPKLLATPRKQRNVIMIVTESVRAMSTCVAYDPDCKYTPFSNKEMPDRMPLTHMRAMDSTTAISLSVMWSGLPPTETREAMHSAPLLWEYANAAGIDRAYFTSQNLLFGNSGTWLEGTPIAHEISATQLEPNPTYETGADDGKLADYVLAHMGELKEPYLSVIHFSNTHFPYKVDPQHSPFQTQAEAEGKGDDLVYRYQDSIYLQDMAMGRMLAGLKKLPNADRNVIVFVSDHGEQLWEHGGGGHTFSMWDVEIRIPAWIYAPPGSLTDEERKNIVAAQDRPLLSLDVFPTIMDLMGLWDAPGVQPFKAKAKGESLLRGGSPERAIEITNCSTLWACAFKNWGAIKGPRKLIAHQAEAQWNCFDTSTDPDEAHNLGTEACADLLPLAEGQPGVRPWGSR
jgi:glucan phosphoethanolaminetransferase (alkaline phosphatase superfamily)